MGKAEKKAAREHADRFSERLSDLDGVRLRRIYAGDVFDYLLKRYESEYGPSAGVNSSLSSWGRDEAKAFRLGYLQALSNLVNAITIANDVQREKLAELIAWERMEHDADFGDGR